MGSRPRRLEWLAPVVIAVVVSALALGGGCLSWEYEAVSVAPEGATDTDGPDNAVTDGPYVLPDGRVCTRNDEDRDGVPDECDNCPNVANPNQSGSAIGTACAPDNAFIPSPTRLLFDPFLSLGSWKPYGSGSSVFDYDSENEAVVGGSVSASQCETTEAGIGRCPLPFLAGSTGAGSSAVVVTTTVQIIEETNGSAGLLTRIHGAETAKKAYLCALSVVNGFAIARFPDTGCSGGYCAPITFTAPSETTPSAAQLPIPADVPHAFGDIIGLRASVSASGGDGGLGEIECRVFDPKRPDTLTSTDPKYAIRITVGGTRWFPSGEVGVYAQRSKARFGSIDVLRGP